MHEEAKRHCVYFIIGLQTDPTLDRPEKNRSTQIVVERYIQLKACVFGDEIVPFAKEQDLEDILHSFKVGVIIIEDVYKEKILQSELIAKRKALNCILIEEIIAFRVVH